MTACTDDERRLVAERLRMSDERDAAGFDCLLAEAVRGREFCETPCEHCHERLLGELADLIEPPTQCPYYHSDRHYCSIHDVPAIDRDALLVLADEMDRRQHDAATAATDGVVDAWCLREYASRIREALGVTADANS